MADEPPVVDGVWKSKAGPKNNIQQSPPIGQDSPTTDFIHTQAEYDDVMIGGLGSSVSDEPRKVATESSLRAPLQITRFERPPTAGSEPGFSFAPAPVAQLKQSRNVETSQISNLQNPALCGTSRNTSPSTTGRVPHNQNSESKTTHLDGQISQEAGKNQPVRSGSLDLSKNSIQGTINSPALAKDLDIELMSAKKTRKTDLKVHIAEERGSERPIGSLPNRQEHIKVFDILPPFPGVMSSIAAISKDHAPSRSKPPQQMPQDHVPRPSIRSPISRPMSRSNIEFHEAVKQQTSKPPDYSELPPSPNRIKKTKPRRKIKPPSTLNNVETRPQPHTSDSTPTQEDLLNILLFRTQQEKRGREAAKALQEAKDAEYEETKARCIELYSQLRILRDNEKSSHALLEKYQKIIPGWKEKVKKFESFLTGLTNDHHKLRDGAKDVQKQRESLQADGLAIKASLREVQAILGSKPSGSKDILTKAKHEIELLEQVIHDQGTQLNEDSGLLDYERERNQRLEERIFEITNNQKEMMDLVLTCRQTVAGRLDELLKHSQQAPPGNQTNDESQVKDTLDRCVNLLEEVRAAQTVKPSDLNHLETSIEAYTTSITDALQQSTEITKASQAEHLDFERGIQEQLVALVAGVKTEGALTEQVTDLREIRATIRERLHLNEETLAEARRNLIGLEERERVYLKDNSELKAELTTLRNHPADDISIRLRLQETQTLNTELHAEIAKLQGHSAELNEQLSCRDQEVFERRQQIETLEATLEESKAYGTRLEIENSEYQDKAGKRYDDLRVQLLKASKAEKIALANEHLNVVHQLQRQKTAADTKNKEMEEQLKEIRLEKKTECDSSHHLRAQIDELESRSVEKAKQLVEAQQKIQQITENEVSKDERLQNLENETLELDRQRAEVEHRLSLKAAEMQTATENNEITLDRINASLTGFNENVEQHTNLDAALEALFAFLSSAKTDKTPAPVATESQLPKSPKLMSSINRQTAVPSPEPSIQDEVMLLGSQDGEAEHITSPPKPSRKVNRHFTSKANNGSSQTYKDAMLVEESQVEETTFHRSIRKTTSSQGRESRRNNETPSRLRNQKSIAIPQFSQLHQSFSQSLDPGSPLGDMRDFFPPTPNQSSSHILDTTFDPSQGKSRMQDSKSTSQATDLPRSRPSTQTDIRSSQVPEPHISRNRKLGRPLRNPNSIPIASTQPPTIPSDLPRTTLPKGILKDPKGTKRNHATMDTEPKGLPTRKRSSSTRDLGPVIGDSQSPSVRSRKTQRRGPDKYTRRFSGEG